MRHSQDWHCYSKHHVFSRLYPYLAVGGSIAIPSDAVCKDPVALATLARQAKHLWYLLIISEGWISTCYILYLEDVSALKQIACSDCRIMNDLCCGHAWTNGVTDCCFKLAFVVPPTRRMCPTSTWSPPSSPCSWTEQAAMLYNLLKKKSFHGFQYLEMWN